MKVNENCQVAINYSITMMDGKVVDRNDPGDPLIFNTGRSEIVEVLEQEIQGLEAGAKKTFDVGPDVAFGARDPEAIRKVPLSEIEDAEKLEQGMMFRVRDENGNRLVLTVVEKDDSEVTFDLNHPLSGIPLRFDVEVLKVGEAEPMDSCGCGCGCGSGGPSSCDDDSCGGGCC